jgi:hypothetical protein
MRCSGTAKDRFQGSQGQRKTSGAQCVLHNAFAFSKAWRHPITATTDCQTQVSGLVLGGQGLCRRPRYQVREPQTETNVIDKVSQLDTARDTLKSKSCLTTRTYTSGQSILQELCEQWPQGPQTWQLPSPATSSMSSPRRCKRSASRCSWLRS